MFVALNAVDGVTPSTIVPVVHAPDDAWLSENTARDIAPAPSVASDAPRRMATSARRRLRRAWAGWSRSCWFMTWDTPD